MSMARRLVPLVTLALGLAACSESTAPGTGGTPTRIAALPRAVSGDERTAIDATTRFGTALLRTVAAARPADGNTVVSPLSVSMALGMTMNGARGATLDAMRRTLGFGDAALEQVNAGYRDLLPMLAGLDRSVTYTLANGIWAEDAFRLDPTYVTRVGDVFGAQVARRDFAAPATLAEVNGWVRDRTGGRIPTILDAIRPDELLLLANAVHFKGNWRTRFDAARTANAPFTVAPGRTTTVRMMRAEGADFRVGRVGRTTVLELPYGGDAWVMTIVMPETGTLPALVDSLDATRWGAYVAALGPVRPGTVVEFPRFRTEVSLSLRDALSAMGMGSVFGPSDFSGLSPDGVGLAISRVVHRTFIDVDEQGTEAAAATVVGVFPVCACNDDVRVDRPFLFAIRERLSGTILFLGTIADPRAP